MDNQSASMTLAFRVESRIKYCESLLSEYEYTLGKNFLKYSLFDIKSYVENTKEMTDLEFAEDFENRYGVFANRSMKMKKEKYLKTIKNIILAAFIISIVAGFILYIISVSASPDIKPYAY